MKAPSILAAAAAMFLAVFVLPRVSQAQTVRITGRVLERAALDPVPGATVRWVGSTIATTTDSAGRFVLSGNPTSLLPRRLEWQSPLMERGRLRLRTLAADLRVETGLFNPKGESIATAVHVLSSPGWHSLPVLQKAPPDFLGFLRVRAGEETYRLKVLRRGGPVAGAEATFLPAENGVAAKAAAGNVEFSIAGLVTRTVSTSQDQADLGDVILEYPARTPRGVGLAAPYGAVMLFDGSKGRTAANQELQAKWQDWPRFTPSPIRFRVVRDPQYLSDTSRVSLQTCCNTLWGYDDIQAKVGLFQDAQVHVEFIGMGEYDNPFDAASPNPNASDPFNTKTAPGYVNSGVYVASRYEVQIQSWTTAAGSTPGSHDMGSLVDQYAPTSNQNRANGVWQSYDITFRGARWNGNTMSSTPYMSVWWNGTQVHNNRVVNRGASGLSNHSGEEHTDPALYGLKLQSEGRDVRYRNVWIKKLRLDAAQTNVAY